MYYSENKCWPNTQFELPPQLSTLDDVGGHLLWQDTKEEPFPAQEETEENKAEVERRFEQLMRDIPKAELHIHIEGTFEPELMLKIAEKNGLMDKLPFSTLDEARSKYEFDGLQSFLDIYYAGCAVLVTQQDFYDLMAAYLGRAAADNVVRAEIFFDPQTHRANGVPFETFFEGFCSAIQDAEKESGISADLIMCFLRHEGAQPAWDMLQEALPFKDRFIAVGLDSSESGFPPSLFEKTYAEAAKHGLKTVAHAGEEGPPAYIWEALKLLKVERIDHGVRCLEDPNLVEWLDCSQMPLTLCPFSNHKLRVYPGHIDQKLKELLHSTLCCTINSDDPAYFGGAPWLDRPSIGYLNANLASVAKAAELTHIDILRLSLNSFRAAFISPEEEAKYSEAAHAVYNSLFGDSFPRTKAERPNLYEDIQDVLDDSKEPPPIEESLAMLDAAFPEDDHEPLV